MISARTVTKAAMTESILTEPIRRLTEEHPWILPVLAQYGVDMCCGGEHTIPEVARLHGLEVETVVGQIMAAIDGARR